MNTGTVEKNDNMRQTGDLGWRAPNSMSCFRWGARTEIHYYR